MKINKIIPRVIVFALCANALLFFSGCVVVKTTVNGIKPIYPNPKSGLLTAIVDSLQPELKWENRAVSKKYDLAIWDSLCGQRRKIIYEKTALSGTSHKVEIVLSPDSLYFWSVRETGSETWSTIHFVVDSLDGTQWDEDMFRFCTPKMK